MPAPKGNQYALGAASGVPKVYTKEWLKEEAEKFREWMSRDDSLFIKGFAVERGYSPQRLAEFAKESEEFAAVYKLCQEWQESKIVHEAFKNRLNIGMTRMFLAKHHAYHENAALETKVDEIAQVLESLQGKSKDLVNRKAADESTDS